MLKLAAPVAPKETAVAPVKAAPVMVTVVPPLELPLTGVTAVTVGDTRMYVNSSALEVAEVAAELVMVMSTAPSDPAGETAVISVAEMKLKVLAAVPPKETAVAPVKAVPVTVTVVPP
jgi:hypothetical protein